MKKYFFAMMTVVLLVSCARDKATVETDIATLEADLFGENAQPISQNQEKYADLMEVYLEYAEMAPDAEDAPNQLNKAGEIAKSIGQVDRAIGIWEDVISKYGETAEAPKALFQMAFTYEEDLQDFDKAKAKYEQFLKLYPDHELASSVQFSINNIGVPVEELIKKFEEQAKQAVEE